MLLLFGLTLLCKEDYAIPVSMLGLYLMALRDGTGEPRGTRWLGLSVFVGSTLFLAFVLAVFIPTFRDGPPHYMAYYHDLGKTPWEIVQRLARDPAHLIQVLQPGGQSRGQGLAFIVALISPLALLPIFGWSRIWVCVPTLFTILLIRLPDARSPFFHFHAPLVPILFWAAAEGVSRIQRLLTWRPGPRTAIRPDERGGRAQPGPPIAGIARLAAGCALASGFFFGKSPLSLAFYDPDAGLRGFWKVLYCPDGMLTLHLRQFQALFPLRAEQDVERLRRIGRTRSFDRLFPLIPQTASVAATDFVRPRFTHHRECHQYGDGGLKPHVDPNQIDYIVIDLVGPYSDWMASQHVRELNEHPDRWEVMHWDPDGELFFYVVRAKR
jgi:hypothetical protein